MKYKLNKENQTPHEIYRKSRVDILFSKSYIKQTDKTNRMFRFQFSFLKPMLHNATIPK